LASSFCARGSIILPTYPCSSARLPLARRLTPQRRRCAWRALAVFAATWLVAAQLPAAEATSDPTRSEADRRLERYLFQTIGLEYGLPATSTVAAVQTRDGYLWVGTPGGLARFDGVRFTVFRVSNTPAFRSHAIRTLCATADGALWIGTDRGVVQLRDGRFAPAELEQATITSIVEDRAGVVWVGTYGKGLYSWTHGAWQRHEIVQSLGSAFVRCLWVDATDRLWMGFERHAGVVYRDAAGFHFFDGNGQLTDRVQTICEQPRGTFWFGGRDQGLFRLREGVLHQFTTADGLTNNQVTCVRPSRDGGLWVLAGGLQRIAVADGFRVTTITRLPDDRFNALCEDAEGSVWLCTPNDYLVRLWPRRYELITAGAQSEARQVRSVTQDRAGNVWFVLYNHGVVRVAPDGTVTRVLESPVAGSRPQTVFGASDGTVWMADGRLNQWHDDHWVLPFPNLTFVHTIFEDRHGRMWFATEGRGITRLDHGRLERVTLSGGKPVPNTATSFAEDGDGTIYLGLWQEGLVRLRGAESTVYNHGNGLPGDEVRAVYADADRRVWVGLKDHGLAVLEGDTWLYSAELSEALADNVRAVIEDKAGRLWLATPFGVMSAPKDELLGVLRGDRPISSLHLASVDDLSHVTPVYSGAQPVAWKASDRRLLFAARDGVVVVDPARLPANAIAPQVHIERVSVDRHALLAPEVAAPPGARVISIDYTAPSFVQPARVFFKYKLEGYDHDWVDAGIRRSATYTHLPPGTYVFRVRACNRDGVWNALGDRVTIVQQPYFYQTGWFYAAALALGALLVTGLHRWRTTALRRENERLERGITERTRELALANEVILERSRELESANNAKNEFLETVSHEIRNPLHGLNGLLGLLKLEPLGGAARELADSVQACARGLTRVFEEVLGYAKLEHGSIPAQITVFSLQELVADLVASFAWHAQHQGNVIQVNVPPDWRDGFEGDAGKIKTIVGNFLGNAIKYAPGRPITVNLEQHAESADIAEIHVEVCDQGPGIPAAEQESIFKKFVRGSAAHADRVAGTGLGLATCRVMAAALHGHIGVDSSPGAGAVFYLTVPLQRAELPPTPPEEAPPAVAMAGTMLVVDDEHYNQLVLRGAALELGYACEIVSNAEQALARIGEQSFDVVLLDWELPGAKGDEVARRIRARPEKPQPVIIATTAHDGPATRQACLEAGMDEFLFKPYHAAEIGRCIARARAGRGAAAASAKSAAPPPPAAPTLSLAALDLHARGGAGNRRESAIAFAANLRAAVTRLEHAVAAGDLGAIDESAHSLRGMGGLVGAQALCSAAREFEQRSRQGSPDERAAALRSIVAAAAALERDIQQRPDRVG
jgi:signal transduction histidine kinase/ligand-binding sensor domain-containing protein/DNA-binding NarL/FixJ family response regulator